MFLCANNNNRASTVLQCFLTAVHQHGLPHRVRSDKGGENVEVARYMLGHPERGPGKNFVLIYMLYLWDVLYTSQLKFYMKNCFICLTQGCSSHWRWWWTYFHQPIVFKYISSSHVWNSYWFTTVIMNKCCKLHCASSHTPLTMCVCLFNMSNLSKSDTRSHITGKSVHNQRIERLWRDVWCIVACNYYATFRYLEDVGLLDPDQDLHIICLHYVFLPRLNWHLQEFVRMWDRHPLSTEGNRSPQQLWVFGLMSEHQENLEQVSGISLYNTCSFLIKPT